MHSVQHLFSQVCDSSGLLQNRGGSPEKWLGGVLGRGKFGVLEGVLARVAVSSERTPAIFRASPFFFSVACRPGRKPMVCTSISDEFLCSSITQEQTTKDPARRPSSSKTLGGLFSSMLRTQCVQSRLLLFLLGFLCQIFKFSSESVLVHPVYGNRWEGLLRRGWGF